MENHNLDNPVWYSLDEIHQKFAVEYHGVRFYKPEYCIFGSLLKINELSQGIDEYAKQIEQFFIVGEEPIFSEKIALHQNIICNQMVLEKPIDLDVEEEIIELKSKKQHNELFDLINLVQPGYFRKQTVDLGAYFGIYKNKKLVAASGERMKMNQYTEVSAIVTHPQYTRRGFAKQLITHTTKRIFDENKLPYLHVAETNTPAIQLYEKLGFRTRRKMSFWKLGVSR